MMIASNRISRLITLPLVFASIFVGGCLVPGTPAAKLRSDESRFPPSLMMVGAEMWVTADLYCDEGEVRGPFFMPVCIPPVGQSQEIVSVSIDNKDVLSAWRVGSDGLHLRALDNGRATIAYEVLEHGIVRVDTSEAFIVSEAAGATVIVECRDYDLMMGGDGPIYVVADEPVVIYGNLTNQAGNSLSLGMKSPQDWIRDSDWISFSPEAKINNTESADMLTPNMEVTFVGQGETTISWNYGGYSGEQVLEVGSLDGAVLDISFLLWVGGGEYLPLNPAEVYDVGETITIGHELTFPGARPCNLSTLSLTLAVETPEVCDETFVSDDATDLELNAAGECRFTVSSKDGALSETVSFTVRNADLSTE
jgi:hypothetical protein